MSVESSSLVVRAGDLSSETEVLILLKPLLGLLRHIVLSPSRSRVSHPGGLGWFISYRLPDIGRGAGLGPHFVNQCSKRQWEEPSQNPGMPISKS